MYIYNYLDYNNCLLWYMCKNYNTHKYQNQPNKCILFLLFIKMVLTMSYPQHNHVECHPDPKVYCQKGPGTTSSARRDNASAHAAFVAIYSPGMGVTKAPFVNFSVSKMFVLAKVPLRLFESHLYSTGATAAELRRHLSNINAIFNR